MEFHIKQDGVRPMSKEAQEKGELFVQALLDEGHSYESMKAGFLTCMVHKGLTLSNGVIDRAAQLLNMRHRNILFDLVRNLKLRDLVAQIRAEAAAK